MRCVMGRGKKTAWLWPDFKRLSSSAVSFDMCNECVLVPCGDFMAEGGWTGFALLAAG